MLECRLRHSPHTSQTGLLEAEPPGSPEPPDVRLDVLAAVLDSIETAPYDDKVLGWLAGLDDPTYRTVASLLWRCRRAGFSLVRPARLSIGLPAFPDR